VKTLFAVLLLAATVPASGDTVDVAVDSILWPRGWVEGGYPCYPRALVSNAGTVSTGFKAWLVIYDTLGVPGYLDSLDCCSLDPGSRAIVSFRTFIPRHHEYDDTWTVACSVAVPGDANPANDVRVGQFQIGAGSM